MKLLEYLSYLAIPLMILLIISYAIKQKKEAYGIFLEGAREGMKVILKIFPTMLAIFIAINLFQVTGAMDLLIRLISPVTRMIQIPNEVVPLGMMRSISGGASIGLLSNVLERYGPDSTIGKIACTILGSSETTLYVIAIYTGAVGTKETRGVLKIALFCDIVAALVATWIWKLF